MLYRIVSKAYSRKDDVLVLRRIVEGVFPYRIEQVGRKWLFRTILPEADYAFFSKCL